MADEVERLRVEVIYEQERNANNVRAYSEEVDGLRDSVEKLRTALAALLEAEWMVTPDWGGDRESVLEQGREALCSTVKALKGEKP